mgnify:FL=1
MNTTIPIIRTYWGNRNETRAEIPRLPVYGNHLVYVWGKENETFLKERGFNTFLVDNSLSYFDSYNTQYGKKLIALDLALQRYDEVLMLDWDCFILRPLDDTFYKMVNKNDTLCPLYAQHKDTVEAFKETFEGRLILDYNLEYFKVLEREFKKYSWNFKEGKISPNFGCVYTSNKNLGKDLIKLVLDNNIEGCIEEHAMFLYANCSLEEYIDKFQPNFVQGVSDDRTDHYFMISKIQKKLNTYIGSKTDMDLYIKHI